MKNDFEFHLAEHAAILGAQGAQEVQENQGAQQGVPVRENIKVEDVHENIKVEDVLHGDEESDDDESDDDSEDEPDTRREERDRRSVNFDIPHNNDYGKGKRRKKSSGHSFLQASFADLTKDDRAVFFHYAWNEYKSQERPIYSRVSPQVSSLLNYQQNKVLKNTERRPRYNSLLSSSNLWNIKCFMAGRHQI